MCETIRSLVASNVEVCDYLKLFVRKFRFEQYVGDIFVNFFMHVIWFASIHRLCLQQFVGTFGTQEKKWMSTILGLVEILYFAYENYLYFTY